MARSSYLDHLAAVPLFSNLSKRDLQKVAKSGDEIDVMAGSVLVEQGDTGRQAQVVLKGNAAVRRSNRKIATLGPGDCIGELALLDRGPRTATVVAETPMKVMIIGAREFKGLLDEVPGISEKLLAYLATRVRELDKKAYD